MKKQQGFGRWALLPAAVTLLMVAAAGWSMRGMDARELLSYAPNNQWLAALAIIACYPVKALSILFPITVLYLAAGLLLPLPAALAVTLAGTAVGYAFIWFIGRVAGGGLIAWLSGRFPKLVPLLERREQNPATFAYLLRVIGVVPYDLGSLLLGACRTPFFCGLLGSWMGLLPGILTNLLLAEQLNEGINTGYLALMAALTALSLLLTWWGKRRAEKGRY